MDNKKELIKLLLKEGYIAKEDADKILTSFSDLVAKFTNEELIILQEIKRLKDKKETGKELTDFEKITYAYFIEVYKAKN